MLLSNCTRGQGTLRDEGIAPNLSIGRAPVAIANSPPLPAVRLRECSAHEVRFDLARRLFGLSNRTASTADEPSSVDGPFLVHVSAYRAEELSHEFWSCWAGVTMDGI